MSTYPAWTAGSPITAAQLNYGIPNYVVAQAQQGVNNSITPTDDTELTFTGEANAIYEVEFFCLFQTAVACDLRTDWNTQFGATGLKQCLGATSTAAAFTSRNESQMRLGGHGFGTDVVYQLDAGGVDQLVWERGIVTTLDPGAINLRFAQSTAVVGNVTRDSGSYLRYKRIG